MLHLFDAFGIELEYMVVDRDTLDVRPISDFVLKDDQDQPVSDIERGSISWSNELTHHVIELKTTEPAPSLKPLASQFQENVREINSRLETANARLLPTAMHPWMDPATEMRLWPHEYHAVYDAFHKVFDCRGHGWANLQSMHINLPFANDEEFGRLHAACRLVLPLLPGLAASSPVVEGRFTGKLDNRLDAYRNNSGRVRSVAGRIIPEQVFDETSYRREILEPMYRDVAIYDTNGVLQNEFLNARGAIARFSRGAIEIRVIDVQECPQADLAIASLTIELVNALVSERWSSYADQRTLTVDQLETILIAAIDQADDAIIEDERLLEQFGIADGPILLNELWVDVASQLKIDEISQIPGQSEALDTILGHGTLAKRITRASQHRTDSHTLPEIYRQLADCLARGEMFRV